MNLFYNTIVFVKDIKVSKNFYESIIGLKVEQDYDSIVFFENHFVIHDRAKILETVFGKDVTQENESRHSDVLIYFETDDLDAAFDNMVKHNVPLIHPIKKQEWGQKVFRFYDPDAHIVEIGEAMHLEFLKKRI